MSQQHPMRILNVYHNNRFRMWISDGVNPRCNVPDHPADHPAIIHASSWRQWYRGGEITREIRPEGTPRSVFVPASVAMAMNSQARRLRNDRRKA